mmetsp:Transcript_37931/g.84923  ORF Transcript_37931/g.84923 Transcript_37931/m.84923 type:complete len:339 (-) Transcript_37931:514-1530(-)
MASNKDRIIPAEIKSGVSTKDDGFSPATGIACPQERHGGPRRTENCPRHAKAWPETLNADSTRLCNPVDNRAALSARSLTWLTVLATSAQLLLAALTSAATRSTTELEAFALARSCTQPSVFFQSNRSAEWSFCIPSTTWDSLLHPPSSRGCTAATARRRPSRRRCSSRLRNTASSRRRCPRARARIRPAHPLLRALLRWRRAPQASRHAADRRRWLRWEAAVAAARRALAACCQAHSTFRNTSPHTTRWTADKVQARTARVCCWVLPTSRHRAATLRAEADGLTGDLGDSAGFAMLSRSSISSRSSSFVAAAESVRIRRISALSPAKDSASRSGEIP